MEIKVKDVIEHEDGSATLEIDVDEELIQMAVQELIINALKKAIESDEKLSKTVKVEKPDCSNCSCNCDGDHSK